MTNYISDDYFPILEELFSSAKDDIFSGKATNLNVLFQLLSALPLNIDLKDLEIKKYAKSLMGNKVYTSFKDRIVMNAIKNQKLNVYDFENMADKIENFSAYYFLNKSDYEKISSRNGVVCKGVEYDGASFFNDCTVVDMPIADSWNPIIENVPPVNSMLIIDKYIFGTPFQVKIQSLIDFVILYKGKIGIPFHLSILFSAEIRGKNHVSQSQIQHAFELLSKIDNIELRLYLDNSVPIDDRLVFTNYTTGNIGHPFDGRQTRFTQNFLGSEANSTNIIRNYRNYKSALQFWNSFLIKIPNKMGNIQTKWESSNFRNRLFDPFL